MWILFIEWIQHYLIIFFSCLSPPEYLISTPLALLWLTFPFMIRNGEVGDVFVSAGGPLYHRIPLTPYLPWKVEDWRWIRGWSPMPRDWGDVLWEYPCRKWECTGVRTSLHLLAAIFLLSSSCCHLLAAIFLLPSWLLQNLSVGFNLLAVLCEFFHLSK